MLIDLLFFVFAGATLTVLFWSGFELTRAREDPLGDRLEELQSQALVAVQRAARRKTSGRGIDRVLNLVSAFPGGEDWLHGSERLLHRAGIRKRQALAIYVILTLLFLFSLAAGMI